MSEFDFIEKQYLGLNKMSLTRRMSLAIFCFVAYYWRENHEKSGELYFFIGLAIMIISIILFAAGIVGVMVYERVRTKNIEEPST